MSDVADEPGHDGRERLRDDAVYWLAPIVVPIVVLAALLALTFTPAAPFVYTPFRVALTAPRRG